MSDTLEARIKALEEQNKVTQKELTNLKDIEAIQKLEMAYAFPGTFNVR